MNTYKQEIFCSASESEWIRHFSISSKLIDSQVHGTGPYEVLAPVIEDPADPGFQQGLYTEAAAKAINRILAIQGVLKVTVYASEISVQIAQTCDGEDMENAILKVIKAEIFPGVSFRSLARTLIA